MAALVTLASGCGEPPTAVPSVAASAATATDVSHEQVQAWVRFRLLYGLRADIEWVVAVARDPRASSDPYDVPLLPTELVQVGEAISSAQNLVSVARRYASQFREEFAGAWIESPAVVLAFTDRLPEHRAEAATLFGDKVVIRQARYTLVELNGWATNVQADHEWFATIGAELVQADVEEQLNAVEVSYRAPNDAVASLILTHFGQPGWLQLDYRGPGTWTGKRGDLELSVVDQQGQPVAIECLLYTLDPRVPGEHSPRELPDGRCFDAALPAVKWLAKITYTRDGEPTTVVKDFEIPPDDVLKLRVVVDP